MTECIPAFLVTVLAVTGGSWNNPGKVRLIVSRSYAYLESRLRQVFESNHVVEIIIDRRRGKRRQGAPHIQQERRRAKILEVVIEADPPTASGPPGGDSGG